MWQREFSRLDTVKHNFSILFGSFSLVQDSAVHLNDIWAIRSHHSSFSLVIPYVCGCNFTLHIKLPCAFVAIRFLIERHHLWRWMWMTHGKISQSLPLSLWSMLMLMSYSISFLGLFFSSLPENKETFFVNVFSQKTVFLKKWFVDVSF